MLNETIYLDPPRQRKLENQGVANVNDSTRNEADLRVLRYELKTFVCDGQYEKGIQDILDTFLRNLNKSEQPGVWISGFFGAGKSHLAKMLRALWLNTAFLDGTTAREVAVLPQPIKDLLVDLSNAAKREGGLHAASGTLGASAVGSVRLALLEIVFKSVGLPTQYPVARFVMWLREEGILAEVQEHVEQHGYDWQEELDNFYVAEGLHAALVHVKPNLFSSTQLCVETLNNTYPHVSDVSNEHMIKALRAALEREGKFPLTLIVLDEVQQFIGSNSDRSIDVQEMVEACCKRIGGKLMVVATGQTAVTGTANLKKLEGRFTSRIELSDADVEGVIRQVILAKKPEAIPEIEARLESNLGEITRQLQGTGLGHRQDDKKVFAADYPILPIRRRFWEEALRVLDQTGTDSQLRNQLSMAHKVIQTNLDQRVPHAIPADYLYFDSADKLLQARMLPRKVHELTMKWIKGTSNEQLMARACGLVFLVNKISASNAELGLKATPETLADLMVEDLHEGSTELRTRMPGLLNHCELLMRVGDEFRIQTEESAAWTDEFLSQRSQLANAAHRIDTERDDRIRARFAKLVPKLKLNHGESNVNRTLVPCFDSKLPKDAEQQVVIWIRDEWATDLNSVQIDARQAGNNSPTIFVFLPKRSADDLRHHLIDFKAAKATLDKRGVPTSPEGIEARSAMETTRVTAEERVNQLLDDVFQGARVFQGGGVEILGGSLQEIILEAAKNSLARLYPHFPIGDKLGWDKVYKKAKEGAPDALKAVGHAETPDKHPVCKAIMGQIGAGKKGSDLRAYFENAEHGYGWSGDTIDGGLQALLMAGIIRALDEKGQSVDPHHMERRALGKVTYKLESTPPPSTQQILQIRRLFQLVKLNWKSGEEPAAVPQFIQKLTQLADGAGGESPKPKIPDKSAIEQIRLSTGNEQLLIIFNQKESLTQSIDEWEATGKKIAQRWPGWQQLQNLLAHAGPVKGVEDARHQAEAIEKKRMLLLDPDPINPLLKGVEETLRQELTAKHTTYTQRLKARSDELEQDDSWQQLSESQREEIRKQCDIELAPKLALATQTELISVLQAYPIAGWDDRIDALTGRFSRAREKATKELEPESQAVAVPRRTLKSPQEVQAWLEETGKLLYAEISKGPVIIQ